MLTGQPGEPSMLPFPRHPYFPSNVPLFWFSDIANNQLTVLRVSRHSDVNVWQSKIIIRHLYLTILFNKYYRVRKLISYINLVSAKTLYNTTLYTINSKVSDRKNKIGFTNRGIINFTLALFSTQFKHTVIVSYKNWSCLLQLAIAHKWSLFIMRLWWGNRIIACSLMLYCEMRHCAHVPGS